MRRDIIIRSMILMLIISILPSAFSKNLDNENINFDRDVFNLCYVEIDGDISSQWKICFLKPFGDYRSTVFYWNLEFKPGSEIKIYSEENGELLYDYNGERQINIFAFAGIYIPSRVDLDNPLHVSISGNVFKIISRTLADKSESNSESIPDVKISEDKNNFINCYLELSGMIHNDWPAIVKLPNLFRFLWLKSDDNNVLFGTYCYVLYENDASIKVYDKKDGDLLWEHDSIYDPLVKIFGFKGDFEYIYDEACLDQIIFSGNALFTSIRLGDWN